MLLLLPEETGPFILLPQIKSLPDTDHQNKLEVKENKLLIESMFYSLFKIISIIYWLGERKFVLIWQNFNKLYRKYSYRQCYKPGSECRSGAEAV